MKSYKLQYQTYTSRMQLLILRFISRMNFFCFISFNNISAAFLVAYLRMLRFYWTLHSLSKLKKRVCCAILRVVFLEIHCLYLEPCDLKSTYHI